MTVSEIDLANFLNQQHVCESLTIKEVKILLDFTELVVFKKGDIIADIGDVGEALYFMTKGESSLMHERAGRETEVGRTKAGEIVGEMSFFDRQPRSVRLRAATEDTQLLKLTRVMYKRLRIEHPYIAVNLLEHVIVSLDHLFRSVSSDVATFTDYFYSTGRK